MAAKDNDRKPYPIEAVFSDIEGFLDQREKVMQDKKLREESDAHRQKILERSKTDEKRTQGE